MADILSLSKARKARARSERLHQAEQNRAKFGRTKAEKRRDQALEKLAEQRLDAHRRDD